MKSLIKNILLLLVLLLLLLPSAAFAASRMITDAELETLQTELKLQDLLLTKAQINNQKSQMELESQREQLKTSKEKSVQLTNQLEELKLKSQISERLWQNAEQALDGANKSLITYKQEMQKQQKRLKRQRNIAYSLFAGAVILLVKK
nr:MAG TPA: Glycine rich protein family [Caudoviricetes sp.]